MLYVAEPTWKGQKGVEDEYQLATNRRGRSTLGASAGHCRRRERPYARQSAAEPLSGQAHLAPLRQTPRRRRAGGDPSQGRERSALTTRLRAATALRPGRTVEPQEWGTSRRFPGRIAVKERAGALVAANE